MIYIFFMSLVSLAICGPTTESLKDQFCTDPRTMRKHAAYTEWADAYSCTRHRCQPGGRNLAIYTVGCKRVEAPESAIECEEVVEDTNMQFPYCCTRLRCLVVVRGEVWTRVLGQPWETLPAAPWSHMYKMKRPPPADGTFLPKTVESGPVYELAESEKVLRSSKATEVTEAPETQDCNEVLPRSIPAPAPDIVIALSTNSEQKEDHKANEFVMQLPKHFAALSEEKLSKPHKRVRKTTTATTTYYDDDHEADSFDVYEHLATTDRPNELRAESSDERFAEPTRIAHKTPAKAQHQQASWTEIPQSQWNERDLGMETDANKEETYQQADFPTTKEPQPSNLQALVDAIGTRMRDIESVVQRMSDKVHDDTPRDMSSAEKRKLTEPASYKYPKTEANAQTPKKSSPETEHYKRFTVRNRSNSKYLRTSDKTTEPPIFIEDNNMNGYFSDSSNNFVRRSKGPKEPSETYMAPIETRRKHVPTSSDDVEKKHKKRAHKKKKGKHGHKKHHGKDEKRKRLNRLSSNEIERNAVSLEDSNALST